jgi:hypothetical protein
LYILCLISKVQAMTSSPFVGLPLQQAGATSIFPYEVEIHGEPCAPSSPFVGLPLQQAGATTIFSHIDENGFYATGPRMHRLTHSIFGPDGMTWNGFRKDLTHKDTNTKRNLLGLTWADIEKEVFTNEFFADLSHVPSLPSSMINYLNEKLAEIDRRQVETFVDT